MTTALVSGATSYLGGLCVADLKRAGWTILTCGRGTGVDQAFDFDRTFPIPARTFQPDADVFIHFAAATEIVSREDPLRAYRINVLGTHAALEFCLRNRIETFVHLSTRHVFGTFGGVVTEDSVPDPVHHYGLSKLLSEHAVLSATGLRRHVLRVANGYGMPDDLDNFRRWSLVPMAFCKDAVQNREIKLRTSGLQPINFVSASQVSELLAAYDTLPLLRHVVSDGELSVRDFAILVAGVVREQLGHEVSVTWPEDAAHGSVDWENFLRFRSKFSTCRDGRHLSSFIADLSKALA